MNLKSIIFIVAIIKCASCADGQLRKTPKVYNALITTDDNIQSSRAFPVIQPTIHETGIAHYPFSPYNKYSYFSPPLIHTGPQGYPSETPIRLPSHEPDFPHFPVPFPQEHPEFSPLGHPQNFGELPPEHPIFSHQGIPHLLQDRPIFPPQLQQPIPSSQENELNFVKNPEQNSPTSQRPQIIKQGTQQKPDQTVLLPNGQRPPPPIHQAPIPLNQFGYPPSLISLQSFYHPFRIQPENPINLQPYQFNNYPLIPDHQINNFQPQFYNGNLLPPFSTYPNTFGVYQATKKPIKKIKKPSSGVKGTIPKATESDIASESNNDAEERNNINVGEITAGTLGGFVKNGASNLNREVPDVPPPPLPSGNVQN